MTFFYWFSVILLVVVVPLFLGFAHGLRPQWFSGRKMLFWFIGTALFALICISVIPLIKYTSGWYEANAAGSDWLK